MKLSTELSTIETHYIINIDWLLCIKKKCKSDEIPPSGAIKKCKIDAIESRRRRLAFCIKRPEVVTLIS